MKNLFLIKKSLAFSLPIMLTLVIILSTVGSAMAQENSVTPDRSVPTVISGGQGPTNSAELETFLDDLLGKEMEENHIAGAAVSIVKDGKLFFAKGYGYADLKNNIPVDPEQTIFRIGSGTKPFTWTAVMQLVEQGKLDLDEDINTYLDFRIPDMYPQTITLKHLLTHTAGFEDLHVDMVTLKGEDLVPVREWLISHMPARVFPPGDCAAYSNYGAALAGYIVARVSGQSYDRYIQEHILDPLGMAHSTAHWPIPPDLRARESVGYMYADNAFQVFPDLIGQPAIWPAGGMRVSVTDMARFMIAHLQGGRYSDVTIPEKHILKESTVQQMHTTLYTPDPRLLGTAYGFFDFSDNGQWTIGHSGTAEPMHSLLLLLPDQNLGVFVIYNSDGSRDLINQHFGFQRAFFDHYYPAPAVEPIQPSADFAERAGLFEGTYRITAMGSYTTLEKIQELMGSTVEIKDSGDGALLFATPWGEWRFVEVEPLYFRQVEGQFAIVFREDDRGHITHMFTNVTPMYAYEKLNWYGTPGFNMPLLLVCILVFLSMLPVALIRGIRKRLTNDNQKSAPRGARVANWIMLGICILNLLFVVGNVLWGQPIDFGIPLIYKVVLGLGVLSAVLTAGALVYTVLAWKNNYWGIASRLYYTLVTVAGAAFIWFLNYWNLLGWRF
jgi:CubicO group peptidase (beta-lactamase class C family)